MADKDDAKSEVLNCSPFILAMFKLTSGTLNIRISCVTKQMEKPMGELKFSAKFTNSKGLMTAYLQEVIMSFLDFHGHHQYDHIS